MMVLVSYSEDVGASGQEPVDLVVVLHHPVLVRLLEAGDLLGGQRGAGGQLGGVDALLHFLQ